MNSINHGWSLLAMIIVHYSWECLTMIEPWFTIVENIWPCSNMVNYFLLWLIVFYHGWLWLIMVNHVWLCLTIFNYMLYFVWLWSTMVCFDWAMFGHGCPCLTMVYHVWLWFTMFKHGRSCLVMVDHGWLWRIRVGQGLRRLNLVYYVLPWWPCLILLTFLEYVWLGLTSTTT